MQHKSKIIVIVSVVIIVLIAVIVIFRLKGHGSVTQQIVESRYSFDPLTTSYVSGQPWPPVVTAVSDPYSCPVGENQNDIVTERLIGTRTYCVSTHSEGAAGSTYTDYTYRTGSTQITFRLRFPNCGNYDVAESNACSAERASFSADQLVLNAMN